MPTSNPAAPPKDGGFRLGSRSIRGLALLAAIFLVIVYVIPRPAGISPPGWRLFGLFAATVAGLIVQPIAGGALVLTAVTLSTILGGLPVARALSGYSDPTVWLVMAAFFISRALISTGLARRIALFFVRLFGRSSLGVCYALSVSDLVLATIIPSNAARSGGVILPIVRSISELSGSKPGATSPLLGSFLMTAVYQSVCVTAAMFFTGQASNPLAAKMAAAETGYVVTWTGWAIAGIVPGLLSMILVPLVVMKMNPPEIRQTPEAPAFARRELDAMGPLGVNERILATVFVVVCGMWVTAGLHGIDITVTALAGTVALLLTGVLTWEDVKNERTAWDIFVWYGGLLMLGRALNDAKVTTEFARFVADTLAYAGWPVLLAVALLVYFYAHYAFASITAHLLSMFPPFLAVLMAKDAPPGLIVYAFACFACLAAGLTNYGTTPAPMFFAHDYVPLKTWWRIGFVASLVNLLVWCTAGFAWWRLVGIW